MITARWQFACDPVRCPVLSPSGVTCRETSVTVRFYDATFSPGCACKQPAVPYWSSTRPLASVTYFHLPSQYCGLSVGDRDTACLTDGSVLFDRSFVIPGYAFTCDATRERIHHGGGIRCVHYPLFPVIHELSISSSNRWVCRLACFSSMMPLAYCACYSCSCKLFPWAKYFVN